MVPASTLCRRHRHDGGPVSAEQLSTAPAASLAAWYCARHRCCSAIAANVKSLVSTFNTMGSQLAALRSGDPGSDSALNQVTVQINQVLDAVDPKALA